MAATDKISSTLQKNFICFSFIFQKFLSIQWFYFHTFPFLLISVLSCHLPACLDMLYILRFGYSTCAPMKIFMHIYA